MRLSGWGNYPIIEARSHSPQTIIDVSACLLNNNTLTPRGQGRSYGDSSLSPQILSTLSLNHFIAFDEDTGVLSCEAGVSLADILSTFVPKGWFLPVTPGTKFVTVGGAIASDVHGKNHHVDGSFSDHVHSFQIIVADGSDIECSRILHPELFHATCGGMGLTGVIVSATIALKRVQSAYIDETVIKAKNLKEVFRLFEEHQTSTYSVAWIDCLSSGEFLGRSLLMLGEHAKEGGLIARKKKKLTIPFNMPSLLLNQYSISAFNVLYYHKQREQVTERRVHYDSYFYPLDSLNHWNRLYGKNGFTQYQFVLPKSAGLEGMTAILKEISASKRGSFLSVLKAFGPGNENYLSFPMEGYTLALDFKIAPGLFDLLDKLDSIVLHYGGRIYLTKDVRMSELIFKQSYTKWPDFAKIRTQYGADKQFHSLQSSRLGL
ncbi:MAG: FAD-binding oxidoreductase [Gammaproteobacteria bacterium]|nr:FAD-binding oxidoreductase [Gammaproteobacteria bacterium]